MSLGGAIDVSGVRGGGGGAWRRAIDKSRDWLTRQTCGQKSCDTSNREKFFAC